MLVLTKRLGIGVLASALKKGLIGEDEMMPAIEEAAALNAAAARAMAEAGTHACTDVSGFGLAGHLGELLDASDASATLQLDRVPIHDRVLDFIRRDVYAGGLRNNRDYVLPRMPGADARDPRVMALFDPQTSGGLLMAVAPDREAPLLGALRAANVGAAVIGEVRGGERGVIVLQA